jgi:uncharacterized protein YbaR (Trm112 family)
MDLDPQLLEILACPSDDHAPLEQRGDTLVPVLLLDEALPPSGGTEG